MPTPPKARSASCGTHIGLVAMVAVVVVVFMSITSIVSRPVRALWLPLVYAVAGDSPSTVAVLTLLAYVVPTVVFTLMAGLRLKRQARTPVWFRVSAVVLMLLPALSLPIGRIRNLSTGTTYVRQLAEYGETQRMAEAVVRASDWGGWGSLLWVVLLVVGVFVASPQNRKVPMAGRLTLVVGVGLAILWVAIAAHVAHQAATGAFQYWDVREWPVGSG